MKLLAPSQPNNSLDLSSIFLSPSLINKSTPLLVDLKSINSQDSLIKIFSEVFIFSLKNDSNSG